MEKAYALTCLAVKEAVFRSHTRFDKIVTAAPDMQTASIRQEQAVGEETSR